MSFQIKNTSKRIETFQQGDQIVLELTFIDEDTQKPTDWSNVTEVQTAHPTIQENGFLIKKRTDTPAVKEISRYKTIADVSGTLNTKYLILHDDVGSVAFWSDNGDSGSAEPSHGADRSVEITTFADNDNADTIATKLAAAVDGDAKFSAIVDPQNSDQVVITSSVAGDRTDGDAGTFGFTFSIDTQGADEIDGGVETPANGDLKITIPPSETIDLKVQPRTTLDVIIDFPSPVGRTTFEIEDAYEITSRDYDLPAPA